MNSRKIIVILLFPHFTYIFVMSELLRVLFKRQAIKKLRQTLPAPLCEHFEKMIEATM